MTNSTPVSTKIEKLLRENSIVFLKRGIYELKNETDDNNKLSKEGAKFSYIFLQTSLELACKAYLVKNNSIQSILKKRKSDGDILSDVEIEKRMNDNELNFIKFENTKPLIRGIMNEEKIELIEKFQSMRNKIIHFDVDLSEADLLDINYDCIYFIVHVLLPMLNEDTDDFFIPTPSDKYKNILSEAEFLDLINLPLYVERMYFEAKKESRNVYKCPMCWRESFGVQESRCYCCGFWDEVQLGYTDCFYCGAKNSVAYDVLNLGYNGNYIWKTTCLNCEENCSVYVCKNCEQAYSFDIQDNLQCTPEKCIVFDE
ncbi:hypothetical protein CN563_02760 [Bacillus sp. AFS026049]|uniref:hypothetical protein n=1 Tax=Peribacillus frigoritolerans TaxID=450367 RepID=UPI000BF916AF|nr:hypothetical protein CN563_02760 [Bacillus sp. AFS026049]